MLFKNKMGYILLFRQSQNMVNNIPISNNQNFFDSVFQS